MAEVMAIRQFPLLAEAVSKLHNKLTPEVAFKHSERSN